MYNRNKQTPFFQNMQMTNEGSYFKKLEALDKESDALGELILELKIKAATAEQAKLAQYEKRRAEFKADEDECFKLLKEAIIARRTVKHEPLISQYLSDKLGLRSDRGQFIFAGLSSYLTFAFFREFYRSYHLLKAAENIKKPDIRDMHMFRANITEILHVEGAEWLAKRFAEGFSVRSLRFDRPIVYLTWLGIKYSRKLLRLVR